MRPTRKKRRPSAEGRRTTIAPSPGAGKHSAFADVNGPRPQKLLA